MNLKSKSPAYRLTRRFFLFLGSLALIIPIFNFLKFKTKKKPVLFEIDKNLTVGDSYSTKDFVLFIGENEVWATARKCTHLGCRINFFEKENYFECPCHQSRFSRKGVVLKGPATKSLQKYPVQTISGNSTKYIVSI